MLLLVRINYDENVHCWKGEKITVLSSEQFKGLEGLSKRFKIFSLFMFVVVPQKKEKKKLWLRLFYQMIKAQQKGRFLKEMWDSKAAAAAAATAATAAGADAVDKLWQTKHFLE